MSEDRNTPQTRTDPGGETGPDASADASRKPGEECTPSKCGIKTALTMLWNAVKAIFDYVDEEVPEHP